MESERIVELVTAEILRRLSVSCDQTSLCFSGERYQGLAIFTGGTNGVEAGLQQLQSLQQFSTRFTVVLSKAAEQLKLADRIAQILGSDIPIITSNCPYPELELRNADIVLVPVLTQNSAAKLACTVSDSMALTLIMQSLMLGKPVIAAINGADPDDNWRRQHNMTNLLPELREALLGNLQKISTYGVSLIPVEQLAAAAQLVLTNGETSRDMVKETKRQVLHAGMVKNAVESGSKVIVISNDTIITPLARDIAQALQVNIVTK